MSAPRAQVSVFDKNGITELAKSLHGLGWEIGSFNGRKVVRHGGGMIGFRAVLSRFVDDGLTVIVLMNLDDADREAIVDGVAALYLTTIR